MCRFLSHCTDVAYKKAKETSVIGDDMQIFKSLHRQGLKRQKKLRLSRSLRGVYSKKSGAAGS